MHRETLTVRAILMSAMIASASPALAGTELVTNGGFESNGGNGQVGYNTSATGWAVDVPPGSYMFLFSPGTADTTGANGQYGGLSLWGLGNGGLNNLPVSPDGGYFIAMDGDFQTSALTQTVNNLVPGENYTVSFYWGAAQQFGFDGDTQQNLTVSLGAESFTTSTVTNPSHGFTGWMSGSFTFTASSPSEVLSFLAYGSLPVPPFITLDGVSMTAVPEPSTWAMMLAGFGGLGFAAYRRRRRSIMAAGL